MIDLLLLLLWMNAREPRPVYDQPANTTLQCNTETTPLLRVTCYLPTGNRTASGVWPEVGMCAAKREWIGKQAVLYDIEGNYVCTLDITDTGGYYTIQNGTSIDVFQETMDDAWAWVGEYGDYMYVEIKEKDEMTETELIAMYDEKEKFVRELGDFYRLYVEGEYEIEHLYYVHENMREIVYVIFEYGQKVFDVSGDSKQGILTDFVKFINNFNDYSWIREDQYYDKLYR